MADELTQLKEAIALLEAQAAATANTTIIETPIIAPTTIQQPKIDFATALQSLGINNAYDLVTATQFKAFAANVDVRFTLVHAKIDDLMRKWDNNYVKNDYFLETLANTNVAIANLESTIVTSGSKYLEVANAASTYATIDTVNANLANTNAYIADVAVNAGEVSNAYLTATFTTNAVFQSSLSNTNVAIADRIQIANVALAVSTAVDNLVDSAPEALDTLNELAAALGDDENFATTIVTALATKASNAAFQAALANTNAWLTASNNAIADRMQVANTIALVNNYLQVANANFFSGDYNDLTNQPNLGQYLQVSNSIATLAETNLAIEDRIQVANTIALVNQYLQVANTAALVAPYLEVANANFFSGDYNDLTNQPNLGQFLQVANANFFSGDYNDLTNQPNLGQYLQVANADFFSGDYNDLTNTPNVNQYLQVSNAALAYATIDTVNANLANTNAYIASVELTAGEVSNAYLTSTFTTNTAFQAALANTNISIADRMQVANTTTAISTAISELIDNAPEALDTLNELAAALGDDENFATTVTNALATKATWTALTTTNNEIRTLIDDRMQVANTIALANQYLQVANADFFSGDYNDLSNQPNLNQYLQVANANFFSGDYNDLTNQPNLNQYMQVSNTIVLTNDRMQVANTIALANRYIEVANADFFSGDYNDLTNQPNLNQYTQVANTISLVGERATWSALTTTNTDLRTLISDRIQVANAATTYTTVSTFNSALANTNAWISTVEAAAGGIDSNTILDLVDSRILSWTAGDLIGADGQAGQILVSYGDGTAYWVNANAVWI